MSKFFSLKKSIFDHFWSFGEKYENFRKFSKNLKKLKNWHFLPFLAILAILMIFVKIDQNNWFFDSLLLYLIGKNEIPKVHKCGYSPFWLLLENWFLVNCAYFVTRDLRSHFLAVFLNDFGQFLVKIDKKSQKFLTIDFTSRRGRVSAKWYRAESMPHPPLSNRYNFITFSAIFEQIQRMFWDEA